ncbi:glutamate-1-semialdehyde 2,1-aminomutase/spore coat polysaccharide biosynthesis protein SpsF [Pseudovibrio denitrificans]|uniref:Glutamate-1-semialdehyde 2,1-aminomutase/spore coat polysaccharide biosynthesis protein SpsF n=1 Tax=Pseudovibrio denitrificans TaxID=258256 RepID=A0A1I7CTW5_9HYPH|nr:glycosyltransferase family protein [Pseudovibrio denitrificans]SFU02862.1 glutamate-1-semialdehyde 2,1-aminomutase/spore coat polysaccharide biosynthesis protein SpsF [Pseudovibrio denitrificans]
MANIPVIVQARMTSSRLPGKVMKPFGGATFLESCLDRCAEVEGISEVICATTEGAECDGIENLCHKRGYRVHRGDEFDVLGRYYNAAKAVKADAVMRITSDCPLADPGVAHEILVSFLEGGADLVTTNIPVSWPIGLDVEVFTFDALEEAFFEAQHPFEREHVSPFIRHRPMRYRLKNHPCPIEGLSHWRMTLDTADDLEFFYKLEEEYSGDLMKSTWREVTSFLQERNDIVRINSDI